MCRAATQASGYGPLKPASARTTCYKPVSVGISTTVTAGLGNQADGTRLFDPLLGREDEAVEARLFFNPIEFDGIKTGVVELFPDTEKLDGVAITEPVLNGDTAPSTAPARRAWQNRKNKNRRDASKAWNQRQPGVRRG